MSEFTLTSIPDVAHRQGKGCRGGILSGKVSLTNAKTRVSAQMEHGNRVDTLYWEIQCSQRVLLLTEIHNNSPPKHYTLELFTNK